MGYSRALEAAGAAVHSFTQFGSYQGDWWAKVTLPDGRQGWINGSYGSCSGCDAFDAEFGYGTTEECDDHRYHAVESCAACGDAKRAYTEKLAAFGANYLDGILTQEEAEASAARNLDWDSDAQAMIDHVHGEAFEAA